MQFFLFVVIFRGLWLVQSTSEKQAWGELRRTATLPCPFTPGEEEVIHWRDKDHQIVHSYYKGKNQLDNQSKQYSGRTTLFLHEVKKGNAALQLSDLKSSDENTYFCYVSTKLGRTDGTVTLQIADFDHSIDYKWINNELYLSCNVNTVYPDDTYRITWYVDNVWTNFTTESFHIVSNSSLSHQCIIHHSIVESTWTGNWTRRESIDKKEDNLTCICQCCKTLNIDLLAMYLKKNKPEQVTVAYTTSTGDITTARDYGNRVHMPEEHSLYLSNLSMNDNGDYTCVIKTSKQMDIEMISINITGEEGKDEFRSHLYLSAIIPVVLLVVLYLYCKTK
ncbi:HERV-H LTR-associating protein 2 isoform X2 [Pseudophryne corroboree]|uniref:HERV-H LTR-associating protein 2 isoform X2 n=1 Tax=Pseudophryne corroboree TaxID=495146 RepID=UPI0030816F8F